MMSYLDTSALVPYYCPEPNSEAVEKIIMETRWPAISNLTEVELASAVSRKIREGNLSQADGNRIIRQFQSHIEQNLFHDFCRTATLSDCKRLDCPVCDPSENFGCFASCCRFFKQSDDSHSR